MNREEEIERFRNEKLPEYIKLAEEEPWMVEKPEKFEINFILSSPSAIYSFY